MSQFISHVIHWAMSTYTLRKELNNTVIFWCWKTTYHVILYMVSVKPQTRIQMQIFHVIYKNTIIPVLSYEESSVKYLSNKNCCCHLPVISNGHIIMQIMKPKYLFCVDKVQLTNVYHILQFLLNERQVLIFQVSVCSWKFSLRPKLYLEGKGQYFA